MPATKLKSKSAPDDATERIRRILAAETIEERLRKMSPKHRALYKRIKRLRDEGGVVVPDINALIREIREE